MNILVSNYRGKGNNVMIFVNDEEFSLDATTVENALNDINFSFADVVEVPDNDVQYYLFEPLWADKSFVEGAKQKAAHYLNTRIN